MDKNVIYLINEILFPLIGDLGSHIGEFKRDVLWKRLLILLNEIEKESDNGEEEEQG